MTKRYPPLRGTAREKRLFQRRSARSKAIDKAKHAKPPPSLKAWRKHPERYDLVNVDAHGASVKSRVPTKREYHRSENRVRGENRARTLSTVKQQNQFINRIQKQVHGDTFDKVDWRSELDTRLEAGEMMRLLRERRAAAFKRNQEITRPTRPNRAVESRPVDPYIVQAVRNLDIRNLPPIY